MSDDETMLSVTVSGSEVRSTAVVDAAALPLPDNLEDCGGMLQELKLGQRKVAMIVNWHIGRVLCHVNDQVLPEMAEDEKRKKVKNPTVWKNRDNIFRDFCDQMGVSRGSSQEAMQFFRRFTSEELVKRLVDAGMLWKTSLVLAKLSKDEQVIALVDKVEAGAITQPDVVEEVAKLNKKPSKSSKSTKADPNAPGRLRVDRFTHGINSYITSLLFRLRGISAELPGVTAIADDETRTTQEVFDEAKAEAADVLKKIPGLKAELDKIEEFCTSIKDGS